MDKLYSQSDLCGLLDITPATLRTYRKNGLVFLRLPGAGGKGGKVMFWERDVENFLNKHYVSYVDGVPFDDGR